MEKNSNLYTLSYGFRKQFQQKVFYTVLYFLFLAIFIDLITIFLVFPVYQKSDSMSPDIPGNAFVLCTPIVNKINRGDVFLVDNTENNQSVLFNIVNNVVRFFTLQKKGLEYDSTHLSTYKSLRRVVGLPGDMIYVKDYIVYIKPSGEDHCLTEFELTKKAYNLDIKTLPENWDESTGIKSSTTPFTLGVNQYFVLADNRFSSMDSRYWGVFEKSDLQAKSFLIYFPFRKIKLL